MTNETEEDREPTWEDYLPRIKAKFNTLSNFKIIAERLLKNMDRRIEALEKRMQRCPHCGKEL